MPKHYAVTPIRRPGKKILSATFWNATAIHSFGDEKKRVTRSLGTSDLDAARLICSGLVSLFNARVDSFESVPNGVPPEAVRLFFDIEDASLDGVDVYARKINPAESATIRAEVERFPESVRAAVRLILIDRHNLRNELDGLQLKFTGLRNAHDTLLREYEDLKRSVVARVASSASSMPLIAECLELFERHLATTTTRESTATHVALAMKLVATLHTSLKTLAEVRPDHIGTFIDVETARTNPTKPVARRRNLRIRIARFINWAAEKYDYPSQMKNVAGVSRNKQRRERGEIVWHELNDVEAAIHAQENAYWKALVATLGYAGLQLAELCWLRRSDVTIDGERGQIWVSPVTDPTDARASHLLKTGNRERHVDIHPIYLLPRLKEYLATVPAGAVYFFPMPAHMRRRQRAAKGHEERWNAPALSTVLRGHKGGKNQKKRPATPGKLPKRMTAATLRHTFGSLLLRSKTDRKSYADGAAAMGNSEAVVAEYYAKLGGKDVSVEASTSGSI